jgi:hypothetical protein
MEMKTATKPKTGLPLIQAARLLEVGDNTLRRWIAAGCPATKGRTAREGYKVNLAEVMAWRVETAVAAVEAKHAGGPEHISRDEADRRRAVALMHLAEREAETFGTKELMEDVVIDCLRNRTLLLTLAARGCAQTVYTWVGGDEKVARALAHVCEPILEQAICEFVNAVESDLDISFRPSLLDRFYTLAAAADAKIPQKRRPTVSPRPPAADDEIEGDDH